MSLYLWVALGSAIGGCLRYAIGRLMLPTTFPWSTIVINLVGSFVIGFFGTLTLAGSRYAAPETMRIFVMVGVCGGFTTFSSFSLQTFDLLRTGRMGQGIAERGPIGPALSGRSRSRPRRRPAEQSRRGHRTDRRRGVHRLTAGHANPQPVPYEPAPYLRNGRRTTHTNPSDALKFRKLRRPPDFQIGSRRQGDVMARRRRFTGLL